DEGQHFPIFGLQKLNRSTAKSARTLAERQGLLHPPPERVWIMLLRFDIDRFVMVFRVENDRQIKRVRIGARETGIFVRTPLHGRTHAIAVTEEDIVSHADFIAIIQNRSAREGEEQQVE